MAAVDLQSFLDRPETVTADNMKDVYRALALILNKHGSEETNVKHQDLLRKIIELQLGTGAPDAGAAARAAQAAAEQETARAAAEQERTLKAAAEQETARAAAEQERTLKAAAERKRLQEATQHADGFEIVDKSGLSQQYVSLFGY
jgi:hypothetical protein